MRNVYNIIIEDKNIIAQIKYTGFQDYTILIEMPYSYMLESLTDAKIQTAAVIFIAVSVYILLMVLFSNLFSRRIHKLIKKIEYFEKGELNVKLKIGGNDEISFIDKKLNEMAARLDKLIKEKYIAEIDRNKLKLDMLQEQMNPHFISNSLEVIGAMASLQGCDDVEMYIKKLGRMLRYNITADNDMIVPFGKEIAYIKQYIAIQQIRNQYNERGDSTINGLKSDVIKGLARANRLLDAMLFERDSKKQIGSKF
jgi:two-component system sensor histidine kinase YesM